MEVYSNVFLLWKPACEISEVDMVALSAVGFTDFGNVRRYTWMQIREIKFYWNSKHSNATAAYYWENKIYHGIIKSFFYESTTQPTVFCTVTRLLPYDTTPVFNKAPHILNMINCLWSPSILLYVHVFMSLLAPHHYCKGYPVNYCMSFK